MGLIFTEIKKKVVNVVEKWVKWWDLSIFNNRFEIVDKSIGCNSVYLIIREYKIES